MKFGLHAAKGANESGIDDLNHLLRRAVFRVI